MVFYILLIVIILGLYLFSYRNPHLDKRVSLLLFGILVLIGGFRDRIGSDYISYMNWYIKGTRDDNVELGYLAIMKVFRFMDLHYHFLFFFVSFLTYLFAYLGVREYTKKSSLSLVLYALIPVMFLISFTTIRQSLSVTIAFYAFSYLLQKKYIVYFLLMMFGVSIHYSCLIPSVVFLIVFRWGEFVKMYHLYALMVITFIIGQIGIIHWVSLFFKDSHYYPYLSTQLNVPVPLLKLLIINGMVFFALKFYDKEGMQFSNQKYVLLLYVCSILFLNLFCESTDLTRVYIYFRIFEIIIIAEIIHDAMVKRRFYLLAFMCCFYVLPYFRAIKIDYENSPKNLKLIPYKTLLLPGINLK
jgi:hypothetical protein